MTEHEISGVFEQQGSRWVASAIEMPWVFASGDTFAEARANFLIAVSEALAAQPELAAQDEQPELVTG